MTGKPITPRKAGRPATPLDDALTKRIAYRVTKAEFAGLSKEAQGLNLSPHEYARLRAVKGRRSTGRGAVLPPAVEAQLIRVGNNLNQLTRRFHMTGEAEPGELAEAGAELKEIFRHILERLG